MDWEVGTDYVSQSVTKDDHDRSCTSEDSLHPANLLRYARWKRTETPRQDNDHLPLLVQAFNLPSCSECPILFNRKYDRICPGSYTFSPHLERPNATCHTRAHFKPACPLRAVALSTDQ